MNVVVHNWAHSHHNAENFLSGDIVVHEGENQTLIGIVTRIVGERLIDVRFWNPSWRRFLMSSMLVGPDEISIIGHVDEWSFG